MRRMRIVRAVNRIKGVLKKWIGAAGAFIRRNREAFVYYAVLAVVLSALGVSAYGYRNAGKEQTEEKAARQPVAIEAQSVWPTPVPETREEKRFIWPLQGGIVGEYAENALQWSETLGLWQTHPALDIAAEPGQAVFAAAEGVVTAVYRDPLWGNTVEIDHGEGVVLRYCGLNTLRMTEERSGVACGDVIGAAGTCPCEEERGIHLHLECLVNGEYTDFRTLLPRD